MILSDLILAAAITADKKRVKLLKSLPKEAKTEATKTATSEAKKNDLKVKTEKQQRPKGKINEEIEHENEMHGKNTSYDGRT